MKGIKWNEYTWYSRLAALLFFIAILPAWTFYMGTQYEMTKSVVTNGAIVSSKKTANVASHFVESSTTSDSSVSSSKSYTPTPIDRSTLLSGKFTENRSPDGKFIAHTFDNEQGDSGVYLTTSNGVDVTPTYCGYFKEWSPDSMEITVFVPDPCGTHIPADETFELHIDGTISR